MGKRKDFKALKEAGINFVKIATNRVIAELLRFWREASKKQVRIATTRVIAEKKQGSKQIQLFKTDRLNN